MLKQDNGMPGDSFLRLKIVEMSFGRKGKNAFAIRDYCRVAFDIVFPGSKVSKMALEQIIRILDVRIIISDDAAKIFSTFEPIVVLKACIGECLEAKNRSNQIEKPVSEFSSFDLSFIPLFVQSGKNHPEKDFIKFYKEYKIMIDKTFISLEDSDDRIFLEKLIVSKAQTIFFDVIVDGDFYDAAKRMEFAIKGLKVFTERRKDGIIPRRNEDIFRSFPELKNVFVFDGNLCNRIQGPPEGTILLHYLTQIGLVLRGIEDGLEGLEPETIASIYGLVD